MLSRTQYSKEKTFSAHEQIYRKHVDRVITARERSWYNYLKKKGMESNAKESNVIERHCHHCQILDDK